MQLDISTLMVAGAFILVILGLFMRNKATNENVLEGQSERADKLGANRVFFMSNGELAEIFSRPGVSRINSYRLAMGAAMLILIARLLMF